MHIIVVGLDDDLHQFAGLATGGPAEGRAIGDGKRLRPHAPLGRLLQRELLGLTGTTDQLNGDEQTQALTHVDVHDLAFPHVGELFPEYRLASPSLCLASSRTLPS
jgi:hypothetical protein